MGHAEKGRKGTIYSAERNLTKSAGDKAGTESSRISFSFSAPLVAYFSRNETKLIPSTAGSNHAHPSSQLYHERSSFPLFSPRGRSTFFPSKHLPQQRARIRYSKSGRKASQGRNIERTSRTTWTFRRAVMDGLMDRLCTVGGKESLVKLPSVLLLRCG